MTQSKALPLRQDIAIEDTWDLTPMFKDALAWDQEYSAIESLLDTVHEYKGTLTTTKESLLKGLKFRDDLSYRLMILYVYAHLTFDVDTRNPESQTMNGRIMSLVAKYQAAFSFYDTELLSVPEASIQAYLDSEEALKLYQHEFNRLFKSKAHVLSEKEEAIIAQASEIFSVPSNTFGMLNNADLEFPFVTDAQGESVQLSHGRYSLFMESDQRDVRKEAFLAMQNTYKGVLNTLSSTLGGVVKVHNFNAKVRHYEDARHAALSVNDIDSSVHQALLDGIHDNIHLMHDYVQLRKDALGLEDMQMYDMYVPIVKDVDLKFTYEEAKSIILEALAVLGDEYLTVLKHAFDDRWIDLHENQGKRSGAYSSGAYGTNPYILMNWQDNIDNLFTLAHELGHSVHSYFTRKYQPYIYGDYSIFVAEVASTTNENLLLNYLLEEYEDPKIRAYLLNHYLDTVKGTVFRQTQFAEFEHEIHMADQNGVALTSDELTNRYRELNAFYYGASVTTPEIGYEWARIPHFYYNYYVYQYATGFAAATLFSERIWGGEDPEPYLNYLKAGSSDYPLNVLKTAGVDMKNTEAVNTTLKKFEERLQELRSIIL